MRDASSFARIGMEKGKFWFACAILVPAFRAESSTNCSNHFFRQKSGEPEWDWRLPAASSKRTAGHSRERIVTTAARVLPFASLKQKRTKKWFSSVLRRNADPKEIRKKANRGAVKFKHPLASDLTNLKPGSIRSL